jgi:hypothetical protein
MSNLRLLYACTLTMMHKVWLALTPEQYDRLVRP